MAKVEAVKFKQNWQGYQAGEVAGFQPERAKAMVEKGVAGYLNRQMVAERPTPPIAKVVNEPVTASEPPADKPVAAVAPDGTPDSKEAPVAAPATDDAPVSRPKRCPRVRAED